MTPAALGQNGWYRGPVNLSLIATDVVRAWPVCSTIRTTAAGPKVAQLRLETDGVYTLQARATDIAGNRTTVGPTVFRLGAQPPVTNLSFSRSPGFQNWFNAPVTVTLVAADATSGLAYVEWRLNGGSWQRTTTLTVATEGIHTLEYRAADLAGNIEPTRTAEIKLDLFPPVTLLCRAAALAGQRLVQRNGPYHPGTCGYAVRAWPLPSIASTAASGGKVLLSASPKAANTSSSSTRWTGWVRPKRPIVSPGGIRIDRDAPRAHRRPSIRPARWTNRNDFELTMALPPI